MDLPTVIDELINAGLTQREIGEACGVHQSTVSDYQTGKITDPSYSIVERLKALHAARVLRKRKVAA